MRTQAMKQAPRAGDELELRSKFENAMQDLNDPNNFKGKLNEVRARIFLQVKTYS